MGISQISQEMYIYIYIEINYFVMLNIISESHTFVDISKQTSEKEHPVIFFSIQSTLSLLYCITRDYKPHRNPKHFDNFLAFLGTQCTLATHLLAATLPLFTTLAHVTVSQLLPVSSDTHSPLVI